MTLNVLHLVDSFNTGGSESQAIQIVSLLHEKGRFKLHVACLCRERPLGGIVRRHCSGGSVEFPPSRVYYRSIGGKKLRVKDHPMFLRAAGHVKNELPGAAFVLAGEGRLTGEIRALGASLGIGPDLFFTGRCEDVAALLSVSDVGVLSSKAEGFSNSILEYMAAGKPVVATNVGGAEEVIIEGETGYLVKSGNDREMAIQILKLLQDPQMAS